MRGAISLLLVCFVASSVQAATRLAGIVVDVSGAPVRGTRVTAGTAEASTREDGTFELVDAPEGEVEVRAVTTASRPRPR